MLINTIIIITLGDKIRNVREEKGFSQKEVALAADVEPSLSTLEKIAIAFNIDVADFFNKDIPITVESFDKSLVEKIKLIDDLEEQKKTYLCYY